jgi:soluble lytic murein transglycosylase-like protein
MFDVANHGGSVDSSFRGFPLRSILGGIALVCALLWWPTAHAGSLYKCTGAHGEMVFSSSRAGYRGCHAISTYVAPAPHRIAPAAPRAAMNRISGSVQTSARNLAADGVVPTSLTNVQGAAETTARPLAIADVQRPSLAAVSGSVQTSARAPMVVAVTGMPGQWSYQESRSATASVPSAPIVADPASRILRGAVYRIVRADGSIEYTNLSPSGGKGSTITRLFTYIATCAACNLHSPIHWGSVALNLTAYADTIHAASIQYGVDEAFLRAIIHAESAFNPNALSIKGAQGLMQLMPHTASDMGVLDAFNSDQNIRGGARYLGLLLQDFNGDERLAAAAYNAGPGAVQRYNGVPPYAETQVYVERVQSLRKRYGEAIRPPLAAAGMN